MTSRETRTLLWRYLSPHRGKVTLLCVLMISAIGLQLASPLIMRQFIDSAISKSEPAVLTRLALMFLSVSLLAQLTSVAEGYLVEVLAWTTTNKMRLDMVRHCLHLDMDFHHRHPPGEMIERIDGDVAELTNFFSRFVVSAVSNLLLLFGVLIVLYWLNWRIGGAFTLFCLIGLVVLNPVQRLGAPYWNGVREAVTSCTEYIGERLIGFEDIRSCGAVEYTMLRCYPLLRTLLRRSWYAGLISGAIGAACALFSTWGQALAAALGATLFHDRLITIGTVYLLFNFTQILLGPINTIAGQVQDWHKASAILTRIQAIFLVPKTLLDGTESRMPEGPLAITFDDVSFGYTPEEKVFKHVTFRLEPGKILGVVGRTGSGKTTLTRLLFRLYDPDEGRIYIGDTDIRQLHLDRLRQCIGVVTQDVQLFHASVRDNLTLWNSSVPDAQILHLIHELGLSKWYNALPDGLDTLLDCGIDRLSAGEAQLLALIRVFIKNPEIVILDEASSRLDPATEYLIQGGVEKLLQGRTGIIVAHRLATLHRADDILILDRGGVCEHGKRVDLSTDTGSQFYHLLHVGQEAIS